MFWVCADYNRSTCDGLKEYALGLGLREKKINEDMFTTVMYAPFNDDAYTGTTSLSGTVTPVALAYRGKALVLIVKSDVLQARHRYFCSQGFQSKPYDPHITLSYNSAQKDLAGLALPTFDLQLSSEIADEDEVEDTLTN